MRAQLNGENPEQHRSVRNDPDMRDGDSAHGNPGEPADDRNAVGSDPDVGGTSSPAESDIERDEEFEGLRLEFQGGRAFEDGAASEEAKPAQVSDRDLPIRHYQRLTVPEIIRQVQKLDLGQLKRILEFERTHRKRKTLIAELVRIVGEEHAK